MTLTEAREKARYTKSAIAREMDVTPLTIANWEKKPELIPAGKFRKLCSLYGINGDIIFFA